jgi:predicted metalloprotease with PDZ domain
MAIHQTTEPRPTRLLYSLKSVTSPYLPLALAASFLCIPASAQQPQIRYEVSFPNAVHHEAEIRATFTGVKQPELNVVMSRSSPGRYALHEFAKNVYNVNVTDGEGHPLEVNRADPYSWKVSGHKGTVVVRYTLFGDRADGTYDGIDATHAHLNMPATFVWAHGMDKIPVSFRFLLPEGSNWKVATQLVPVGDGSYTAPNVDMMMDSPVELSAYDFEEWTVGDRQFRIALHHTGTKAEAAAYARMARAVVTEAEGVFGAFPKYDGGNYTFLIDYLPYASGDGMEHRDSTVIAGTRSLKQAAAQSIGSVAHEFFHSWNVERIRPKALEPFDFERANMSGELWFAEGFTNYYGPLILKRAGLSSIDRFNQTIGVAVNAVLTLPGRDIFNVVEMARQAPFVDAATANDPVNTQNTFISYYIYGEAIALGADLTIRTKFPGKSLDDWMRQMWKEHPDVQKPYTLDDLQSALGNATGDRVFAADFFRRHVLGKEAIEYQSLLEQAGLTVRKRPGNHVWLGALRYELSDTGMNITGPVLRDSPAYIAGLDRGDKVLEFDGKAMKTEADLTKWLDGHKPGDKTKLKVESRGGKKDLEMTLTESPSVEVVTLEKSGKPVTKAQLELREQWLSSKAVHALPEVKKYCSVCQRAHPFEYDHCPFDGSDLGIIPGNADEAPPASGRPAGRRAN